MIATLANNVMAAVYLAITSFSYSHWYKRSSPQPFVPMAIAELFRGGLFIAILVGILHY